MVDARGLTIWSLPGSLLWIPALVHAFIGWEIVQSILHPRDAFDGFAIAWQITVLSVPIAIAVAIGWAFIAFLRWRVPARSENGFTIGCSILAEANIIAPAVLFIAVKGLV